MTGLLDRVDNKVARATAGWDSLAVFGYGCVFLGGLAVQASIAGAVALYFWGDLL